MSLPTTFAAKRVSFAIRPDGDGDLHNPLQFTVEFPNLGAAENEDLNDAANAAALAAYNALVSAFPAENLTMLRRYEGIEASSTDITPTT